MIFSNFPKTSANLASLPFSICWWLTSGAGLPTSSYFHFTNTFARTPVPFGKYCVQWNFLFPLEHHQMMFAMLVYNFHVAMVWVHSWKCSQFSNFSSRKQNKKMFWKIEFFCFAILCIYHRRNMSWHVWTSNIENIEENVERTSKIPKNKKKSFSCK